MSDTWHDILSLSLAKLSAFIGRNIVGWSCPKELHCSPVAVAGWGEVLMGTNQLHTQTYKYRAQV